jgi:hypothetical protein
MRSPVDVLKDHIGHSRVIPVIGAGVSYATAGIPGWKGLVQSGLDFAYARGADPAMLMKAGQLLNENCLVETASLVQELLGAPGGAYSSWLSEFFLSFKETRSLDLVVSIKHLLAPFCVTTNYDTLLSDNAGLFSITPRYDWTEVGQARNAIQAGTEFLLHLHGVYDNPASVILGAGDYERIKKDEPYKFILNQLWSERHLLFIGCSRDGALDPDFLATIDYFNALFPHSTTVHYLLVNDRDDVDRLDFLKKYHIEVISYGEKYEDLPAFIDSINPNYDVAHTRLVKKAGEFTQLLNDHDRSGRLQLLGVNESLARLASSPGSWIEPNQLLTLKQSLSAKNATALTKREAFEVHQHILHELIDQATLDAQVLLFQDNAFNPAALSNETYVMMAAQAYAALKGIPADMMIDIQHHDPYLVHSSWNNGRAASFINELDDSLRHYGDRFYEEYKSERYFFENLKRIMISLQGVLGLSPAELYPELADALISPNLPRNIVAVTTASAITIRPKSDLGQVIASLPAGSFNFIRAEIARVTGTVLIIGYTSTECFYWNPTADKTYTAFFSVKGSKKIAGLLTVAAGDQVIVYAQYGAEIIVFCDFMEMDRFFLPGISDLNWLDTAKGFAALIYDNPGHQPSGVAFFNDHGTRTSALELADLWCMVSSLPGINVETAQAILQEKVENVAELYGYPFLTNMFLRTVKWDDRELLALRINFSVPMFSRHSSTVILLLSANNGILEQSGFYYMPGKLSLAFDTIAQPGKNKLVAGYLDLGRDMNLVEVLGQVKYGGYDTGKFLSGYLPVTNSPGDVFQLAMLDDQECLINQQGGALIKLNLLNGHTEMIPFPITDMLMLRNFSVLAG